MINDKRSIYFIFALILIMHCTGYAQQDTSVLNEFLTALGSENPRPEKKAELELFGQFIGSWEFDWIGYNEDGTKEVVKDGEWIFSWVLEGRVIQDVWIIPGRAKRVNNDTLRGEYGTTIRFYDEHIKKCRVIWIGPLHNKLSIFTAEQAGDEIVLTGENEPMKNKKWIFSKIEKNSFHWREEVTKDHWQSRSITQEFTLTRKK